MVNRSRRALGRGDRRRNEKLRRLRGAVPEGAAILAIDLARAKQVAVATGPGDQTLARRTFVCSPWGVDQMIDWGLEAAAREGLERLVLACEPTGHRWKPVLERCRRGITLVCVQPLLVHREREREDFTKDRSDPKDATLIARLARGLRCCLPLLPEPDWARLRHLPAVGATRLDRRVARRFHEAARAPRALPWEREGAAERAAFPLADLLHAKGQVAECEDRMVGALGALGYAELATSIRGLSPAQHDPVFRARDRHLTGRERNPLNDAQARAAVAAALLRQLHAVLTGREAWDPEVAGGKEVVRAA